MLLASPTGGMGAKLSAQLVFSVPSREGQGEGGGGIIKRLAFPHPTLSRRAREKSDLRSPSLPVGGLKGRSTQGER
jgi:hypothetical protein